MDSNPGPLHYDTIALTTLPPPLPLAVQLMYQVADIKEKILHLDEVA